MTFSLNLSGWIAWKSSEWGSTRLPAPASPWSIGSRRGKLTSMLVVVISSVAGFPWLVAFGGSTPTVGPRSCGVLSSALLARLQTAEMHWLRKIVQVPKRSNEGFVAYQQRSARACRQALVRYRIRGLSEMLLHSYHGWAGHLARQSPSSNMGRAVRYKSLSWWRLNQALLTRLDPRNTSGWRHRRPGRWTRWESPVHDFSLNWMTLALDREAWSRTRGAFTEKLFYSLDCKTGSLPSADLTEPGIRVNAPAHGIWPQCATRGMNLPLTLSVLGPPGLAVSSFKGLEGTSDPSRQQVSLNLKLQRGLVNLARKVSCPVDSLFLEAPLSVVEPARLLAEKALLSKESSRSWNCPPDLLKDLEGLVRIQVLFSSSCSGTGEAGAGVCVSFQHASVSSVCFSGFLFLGRGYSALYANSEAAFLATQVACTFLDWAITKLPIAT